MGERWRKDEGRMKRRERKDGKRMVKRWRKYEGRMGR